MTYSIEKSYVFVVLEHNLTGLTPADNQDSILHGIYTHKEMAEGKRYKLNKTNSHKGYLSILKKPIQGKVQKSLTDSVGDS